MMKVDQVYTPAILVDLDSMENNLQRYGDEAKKYGKQVWPMLKTHKSIEFAKAQVRAGATGFLCGTLDEAEALCEAGFRNLMYAYPVATQVSINRAVELAKKCNFIARIDGLEAAEALNAGAAKAGVKVNYTIIVDSGLHRFGVLPEKIGAFAEEMKKFGNLVFKGISTHPGHVYSASCKGDLPKYIEDECSAVAQAVDALTARGFTLEIISSGSTPTFWGAVKDKNINILHPGNYIFNDAIQLSTETATREQCSLYVLASVISHPREGLYICDAGAKCLGLDQGAHGNSSIKGFGVVKGHPELVVEGLSEEVGKLYVHGKTNLKVGDKIEIIPNHSCSTANLTSYYISASAATKWIMWSRLIFAATPQRKTFNK